jgi:hypothetical protein
MMEDNPALLIHDLGYEYSDWLSRPDLYPQ